MSRITLALLTAALITTTACGGEKADQETGTGGDLSARDIDAREAGTGGDFVDAGEAGTGGEIFDANGGDTAAEVADAGNDAVDVSGTDLPTANCHEHLLEEGVKIPMRDGKFLEAVVRRPEAEGCELPTIFVHTPYNKAMAAGGWFYSDEARPLFDSMDYAVVIVDWRGFWGSADAAVDQPKRGEDGYDVIEWIAAQDWSDGKVGTYGVSALCRVQYETAVEQPPHLIAAVPIFCPMNIHYEEYYPGGVLRREFVNFVASYFGGGIELFEQAPYQNFTWNFLANQFKAKDVEVPMLVVAGWWDLWNTGSMITFDQLVAKGAAPANAEHRLLVGGWMHFAAEGDSIAGHTFTEQEKKYMDVDHVIQKSALAFFDFHLRGLDSEAAAWAMVRYEQGGEESWEEVKNWPPATQPIELFLTADGGLGEKPDAGELPLPYDPDDPSPTVGGQNLSFEHKYGPHDQAEVLARADALSFVTEPLAEPLRIAGTISVTLDVATTGADTDFAVRLTDVDGGGKNLLIGEGIQRLKLRDDLSTPSEVVEGERYTITVNLTNHLAYTFAAGHRVGIIVSSSNFDHFDRNPNNGDDFYTNSESSIAVVNTIYADGSSALVLPAL